MKMFRFVAILLALGGLGTLYPVGKAQSAVDSSDSASSANATAPVQPSRARIQEAPRTTKHTGIASINCES